MFVYNESHWWGVLGEEQPLDTKCHAAEVAGRYGDPPIASVKPDSNTHPHNSIISHSHQESTKPIQIVRAIFAC
jgi:hypothetical protein